MCQSLPTLLLSQDPHQSPRSDGWTHSDTFYVASMFLDYISSQNSTATQERTATFDKKHLRGETAQTLQTHPDTHWHTQQPTHSLYCHLINSTSSALFGQHILQCCMPTRLPSTAALTTVLDQLASPLHILIPDIVFRSFHAPQHQSHA